MDSNNVVWKCQVAQMQYDYVVTHLTIIRTTWQNISRMHYTTRTVLRL